MISDARTVEEGKTLETDVCIVGGGAAGIAAAREFCGSSVRVCLLESGGLEIESPIQSLFGGTSLGYPYFPLTATRLRYFGGATNHWGGLCRAFDEEDFQKRDWVPHSGWPIAKADLDPYYSRARDVCQVRPYDWKLDFESQPDYPALPFDERRIETRIALQAAYPRSFKTLYEGELRQSETITAWLYANVFDIETDASGATVTGINVVTFPGRRRFQVRAKHYVLAMGGIENPRLLLLSDGVHKRGIGNEHDLVGRYFMDHPRRVTAEIHPSNPRIPLGLYQQHYAGPNRSRVKGYLSFSRALQKAERMLDVQSALRIVFADPMPEGFTSMMNIRRSMITRGRLPRDFGRKVMDFVRDFDDITVVAAQKGLELVPPVERIEIVSRIEPCPNRESRVRLGEELDELGQRRVELDWRLSDLDFESVDKAVEILGQEVGKAGVGRFRVLPYDRSGWEGGHHHVGTTRMHDDPKQGVVDRDCRVHGVENLYLAGSSVFPTAGSGTPTMTIVALSMRLAHHLKEKMS